MRIYLKRENKRRIGIRRRFKRKHQMFVKSKTQNHKCFFAFKEGKQAGKKPLRIFNSSYWRISIAVLFSFIILSRNHIRSVRNSYLTFAMCARFPCLFHFHIPAYLCAEERLRTRQPLSEEMSPDKYANTAVITFRDTDAFPADKIKLKAPAKKSFWKNKIDEFIMRRVSFPKTNVLYQNFSAPRHIKWRVRVKLI